MTPAQLFATFRERYKAHQDKYGSCPIEDGTLANLADRECRHGFLPSDPNRSCKCWAQKKGKR